MHFSQVMEQLERAGTEQNRKTYGRHGVPAPLFGVSTAELKKLQKAIRKDQDLARELWQTGNYDAQVLATMICDPASMSEQDLDDWIGAAPYNALAAYVAGVAARSPHARGRIQAWTASGDEFIAQAGWNILGEIALKDKTLPESYFAPFVEHIRKHLHQQPNRTRYAMNGALIAIGVRTPALEKQALAAAAEIGKVDVDHGDTSCQTPDATSYIARTLAKKGHVLK